MKKILRISAEVTHKNGDWTSRDFNKWDTCFRWTDKQIAQGDVCGLRITWPPENSVIKQALINAQGGKNVDRG